MCYVPWYRQFYNLNPGAAERRSLVLAYASSQSEIVQSYLQGLFPTFWRTCDCPGGGRETGAKTKGPQANDRVLDARLVGPSLGLDLKEEADILEGLFAFVLPKLRSSAQYQKSRDPKSLRFPVPK